MAVGAATSALVSFLSNSTALPMTGVMAACALSSFTILLLGSRIIVKRASIEEVEAEISEMITTS
jgi:DHA1 family bicyclomycin/chloramphenicol resistance-like MFS transporter